MKIRKKLLFYFIGFSLFMTIVNIGFYYELTRLIDPLTVSIPQTFSQLTKVVNENDIINRLSLELWNTNRKLERFVITKNPSYLKDYYASRELSYQLMKESLNKNSKPWQSLAQISREVNQAQSHILNVLQHEGQSRAEQMIASLKYSNLLQILRDKIDAYNQQFSTIPTQFSVANINLEMKKTASNLEFIIKITILIFILIFVLSCLLVIIVARNITRPIELLHHEMEDINLENININLHPLLLGSKGEIGDLSKAYIELIKRLKITTVLRDDLELEVKQRKIVEKKLKESNQELNHFAYVASHDLRAPLRGIENIITWIEDDCYNLLPKQSQEHFNLIKNRVNRMDELILGILEYSRIGKININKESVDLNNLLKEVIDNLSPPAHINIIIDNIMPTTNANRIPLLQVFLNLMSNSIKFNDKPHGEIHLGYKEEKTCYEFYVSDNGPGIAPEFHEKIFVIFQTLQLRDVMESTGIGLAITKKIIEQHGGKIWLSSDMKIGTTFYFTWPK